MYINKTTFAVDQDGYFYDKENDTLLAKESGFDFSLTDKGDFYFYQTDNFVAKLDKETLQILEFTGVEDEDFDLKHAAEMSMILVGAKSIQ